MRKPIAVAGYVLSTLAKPFLYLTTSWTGVLAVRFTDRLGKGLRTAPRDALVEYSIQRLLPVIAKEREKHRKRKKILDEINSHLEQGLNMLRKSKALLGADDPVYAKLEAAMTAYAHARKNIENFIERCDIIEEF